MEVVVGVGQREAVALVRRRVFGVATVEGVAGEASSVAEVLAVRAAEAASPVRPAEPGHADAIVVLESSAALLHRGDDLVAEDQGKLRPGQLAVCDVQVGAAHAAGADFEQDLAGARFRQRTILETQRGPRRL